MNKNDKKIIINAFQEKVVSVLKQNGFTGRFPHFRKIKENQIYLLSIQFDKWGGGYRICLSKCPAQTIKDLLKRDVEPQKATAWHFGDRYTSDWFRYDYASEDKIQQVAGNLALQSVEFLNVAKHYWEGRLVQRQSKWLILKTKLGDLISLKKQTSH